MARGHHHHQIDTSGPGRHIARVSVLRVAARGRKMNGPCRAPSRHTSSFAVASSPHVTATSSRASAHTARLLTSFEGCADQLVDHGAAQVGACGQFVGLPLILTGLDRIGHGPSPHIHIRRPLAQAPRLDAGNMLHRGNPHTQIGEA